MWEEWGIYRKNLRGNQENTAKEGEEASEWPCDQ